MVRMLLSGVLTTPPPMTSKIVAAGITGIAGLLRRLLKNIKRE
jgi:hypothetical protein